MESDRRRRTFDVALLLAALLGGGAAVTLLRQPWAKASGAAFPWELLVAAAVLGGLGLRRADRWLAEAAPAPRVSAPASARSRAAAAVMLAVALLLTAGVMVRLWPNYHRWHGTVAPWIAAMVLTAVASFLLGGTRSAAADDSGVAAPAAGERELSHRLEIGLFLGIAAAALFVRVWRIGEIPSGIYVDETNGGLDALYVLEGRDDSPFGTGWYGTPNGYVYYMALVFKLLGATWAGLKTASILPGFLTVLAMYPLGRLMFGQVGGLSAMAFLAFNRWHMSMSRWGWNEVVPPLFQVLATFFLLRGLRDRRSSDFALGGLLSGLMMYTYLSSRLALATLGLFAVYFLLVERGGPIAAWRRHGRGLLLFLFAWIVAVAPIAVTHITDPFTFFNRVGEISVFKDIRAARSYEPLKRNIVDHLKFFHQIGDHQTKHNLPDEPEADPVVGLLFVIGLAYGLLRLRDGRRGLLWLWLLLGMAGGVFSSNHESPQSYRTLTAAPAIALLAGDVLARLGRAAGGLIGGGAALEAVRRRRAAAAGAAVVVAGCAFAAAWETSVYFGPQASSPAVRTAYNATENGVAHDVLAALSKGESVFVSPRFYGFAPLRFLVYGQVKRTTGRNTLDDPPYGQVSLEQDLPVPDTGRDTLLLLDIEYQPLMSYLRLFYPSATIETAYAPDESPIYVRARLTRADLDATAGLDARVTDAGGTARVQVVRSLDATEIPPGAVSAEWRGSVRLERGGRYDLAVPAGFMLALDGAAWSRPRYLGRGLHALEISVSGRGSVRPPTLEWVTPEGTHEKVPVAALFRIRQPNLGLTTFYYANRDWSGPALFETLTPVLYLAWIDPDPVQGEFSARFVGSLRITRPGAYRFIVQADDEATMTLDGALVGRCVINKLTTFPALVTLSAGDHPIEIRYVQLGGGNALDVYWQPPGQREGLIPPENLVPLAAPSGGLRPSP
ncbi:MAG TPA: PA14 domain-containing protein [Thermoanaerobaculaceae bacterium]|nr:PA14 domain-containing protein [Thermoanaerobaculaceae bacterium]